MGWSEVAARHHARRLERERWLERCPMLRGQGSLFWTTRKGVRVLGLPLIAVTDPASTWWAHDSACAWTAAWATIRGRQFLGPREVLIAPEWSGRLQWADSHSYKRSGHRPDIVLFYSGHAIAIEVELVAKSTTRLDAILKLHKQWIIDGTTYGVIYVCGDEAGSRRIESAADRVGLSHLGRRSRIELLETIKLQTRTEFERSRATGKTAASRVLD
jgi:hypothetical protein